MNKKICKLQLTKGDMDTEVDVRIHCLPEIQSTRRLAINSSFLYRKQAAATKATIRPAKAVLPCWRPASPFLVVVVTGAESACVWDGSAGAEVVW